MASISCGELITGLNPSCTALNKVGGTKKRVYVGQKSQISGITSLSNGDISGFTMNTIGSIPATFYKFIGKRDKNSFAFPLTAGDNINTFNHTAILSLYYSTSADLEAIEQLCNADDLVVIMEDNNDRLVVLGWDNGLNASAGEGGSGTMLQDSTAYVVTLTGEQKEAPKYFSTAATATHATNLAYLDSISAS